MLVFKHAIWRWLWSAVVLSVMLFSKALASDVRAFNLDEGDAAQTLKRFARQSRASMVYDADQVKGVQTQEVVGRLSPSDALTRMLEGTPLVFKEDLETGAFAVTRMEDPDTEIQILNPKSQLRPDMTENIQIRKPFWRRLLAIGVASSAVSLSAQAQEEETEEIFDLSPFTISAEEDSGYLATSTLAGTRIKTSLADVGASITAITQEFMEDTGSTNLNDLLIYTANTETGTAGGNFSASIEQSDAFGRGFQSGAVSISNPQSAQRVRGLSSADITRNLFRSSLTWDDYNVSRVEIVRGANSMLFGQGSPAGIINVNLIRPFFGERNELKLRIDDQGSFRTTFDSNFQVIEDKLAIRVAGLYDQFNFRQKPAFEDDQRLFATATWKITDNFTLRANGEVGNIRANRPNPFGPTDALLSTCILSVRLPTR